jgi:hypothetical protein
MSTWALLVMVLLVLLALGIVVLASRRTRTPVAVAAAPQPVGRTVGDLVRDRVPAAGSVGPATAEPATTDEPAADLPAASAEPAAEAVVPAGAEPAMERRGDYTGIDAGPVGPPWTRGFVDGVPVEGPPVPKPPRRSSVDPALVARVTSVAPPTRSTEEQPPERGIVSPAVADAVARAEARRQEQRPALAAVPDLPPRPAPRRGTFIASGAGVAGLALTGFVGGRKAAEPAEESAVDTRTPEPADTTTPPTAVGPTAEAATSEAAPAEVQGGEALTTEMPPSGEGPMSDAASSDAASSDAASSDAASGGAATGEAATGEVVSGEAATAEALSGEAATSGVATAAAPTPEAASSEAACSEAACSDAASSEAATGEVVPDEVATAEGLSGDAASGAAASGEAASGEVAPAEALSGEELAGEVGAGGARDAEDAAAVAEVTGGSDVALPQEPGSAGSASESEAEPAGIAGPAPLVAVAPLPSPREAARPVLAVVPGGAERRLQAVPTSAHAPITTPAVTAPSRPVTLSAVTPPHPAPTPDALAAEHAAVDLALLRTLGFADPNPRNGVSPVVDMSVEHPDEAPEPPRDPVSVAYRVTGRDHAALSDVAVALLDQRGREAATAQGAEGAVEAPRPGGYVLVASADGHQPGVVAVRAERGGTSVEVPLVRSSAITGRVTDGAGAPVAAAALDLLQDGELVASATADEAGDYRFADLAAGEYTIAVQSGGRAPVVATVRLDEEADGERDLTLSAAVVG